MNLAQQPPTSAASIEDLLAAMRPKLHRYCARMVGSVIDGEDVLQDALIKAVESFPSAGVLGNPEGWLFRIAHNTALDFLRRRNRQQALQAGEEVDMIADQARCRRQPRDRRAPACAPSCACRSPSAPA